MSAVWPPIVAAVVLGLVTTAVASPLAARREYLMGTLAEVRVHAIDRGKDPEQAIEMALGELHAVDRLMAVQRPESDVSRLNRDGARRSVPVDVRVIEILQISRRLAQLTAGAFDVTVLPTVAAWGFLGSTPSRPTGAPQPAPGFERIVIDSDRSEVRLTGAGVGIDLGGIAKGYALDRARAALLRAGVRSAFLDLGGNVATLGSAPDGGRWRLGIRHPRRPGAVLGMVEIGEGSASTSGDAERFVEDEHGRAGHVFDPRTGTPARGLVSATIVSAAATLADGLSTAAIVLGRDGLAPILPTVGAQAVLVRLGDDGHLRVWVSPGLHFEAMTASVQEEGFEK